MPPRWGETAIEHLFLLILAAVIVGMSKGGLASAAALAVPMLALYMNPIQAAAILLPVFLVTDWVAVWLYRRDYSGRNLAILIPAILLGISLATVITPWTPDSALLLVTGLIGLWYCGRSWLGRVAPQPAQARIGPGLFWGALTGVTSFITHSGSPPAQAYLLPQRLPKLEFAGTMAIAFTVSNLAKIPGYYALGLFEALDWVLTATLVVAGICGTVAGRWIVGRLHDHTYVRVIEGLLLALSLVLLWRGATLALGL